MKLLQWFWISVALIGCAQLHHVQVGDVDARGRGDLRPFEVKFSETGVDIGQVKDLQEVFLRDSKTANRVGDAAQIIALFQMGPVTGYPVYTETYARQVLKAIYAQCPSGRVTGLLSIRESRQYPVISGEIVKVKGFCRSADVARVASSAKRRPAQDDSGEEGAGDEGEEEEGEEEEDDGTETEEETGQ